MRSLMPWRKRQEIVAPSVWNGDWFNHMWEQSMRHFFAPLTIDIHADFPAVDVSEDKNDVTVRVEMPGMSEKDIECTWRKGILHIHGDKKSEREAKKKGNYYSECSYGYFSRDIPIDGNVDWNNAKANYKQGVLTVKIPRKERTVKTIEVKIN